MPNKIGFDIENEKEWRRELYTEVKEIRKELASLRVRVAVIGSFFGMAGTLIMENIKHWLHK